ncbi:YecA family protein [Capnocytophaga cynodegmi]|uniref:Putative SEC-C motif domain protein n=1 Tax=Capnocytophaga cynodegmi TaxID=28189 RepID=A0A0B7HIR9_9FLAO|nr:SEC-C domain-containing protein [Capnocytophaga cynodegmi]CEN35332.1 putative SEC-C motif domain protein [Capnocytophaga cynodegmi]CEN39626.1 putative SEC-C motif domain protein [Capnocytophaga cynodegmi]
MSNKIGRNDPCPCGSGKKYKECCINSNKKFGFTHPKPNKIENKTFEFIELNNSHQLLNFIIGLQMQPNNHGKNVRMEKLAAHIVTNFNSNPNGNLKLFKQHLDTEFASNYLEDIPENLFSETIVFYGGNYTVFSGICGYAIEIFRNLTETIFTQENDLPKEFKNHVYSGVALILELGKILSTKFKIEGNIEGAQGNRKFVYSSNEIDTSFNKDDIIQICQEHQIDPRVIDDFIVQPNDSGFSNNDPDKNPLLKKPIIKFEDKYYFVLISNQVNALNEFIIRLGNEYNCNQKLMELYHAKLWHEQWGACEKMGWKLTDIELPLNNVPTILKERVFQFDINRLAYVCYVHNDKDEEYFLNKNLDLDKRITEVITEFKKNPSMKDYKFLSLVTYDCMGRKMFIGIDAPQKDELRLSFSMHQFNFLCSSEKWNNLSLWKFAKSYEIFSKTTNSVSTDTLDMYSIYKAKDESFYFGDDTRPNFFTVVPSDGSRLIKEAKIKKKIHGILNQINEQSVFIPSTKYANYAPLYKPLNDLGYYTICLKTFDFPIWLTNHQVKDKSMIKQVQNFAEAIGFWLYKLQPEIAKILNRAISNFFEIHIILDQKLFEDTQTKDIVESKDTDNYSFSLNENILGFSIPFSKMKTFTGSSNFGEREMMKEILNAFNLVQGISFSEQDIDSFIDRCIPLGQAKMILSLDCHKDPLIDNRWLIKPFYISDSEVDILLDEVPLLIEQTTEIPKNIDNEEDKKKLFNTATALLLDTLNKEIQNFEFEFLLRVLLELHETLVWKREHNKTMIPAQILCFGDLEGELKEILEKDNKLVKTSLATRCLIEYIAAKPTKGSIKVSLDDVDRLLVLMHEIVNYGFLSDAIHFKLANPTVGKLDSGRIGISREFFDDKLKLFAEANTKEEVNRYIENFDNRFEIAEFLQEEKELEDDKEVKEIDSAFLEDWGIGYLNIYKFCFNCFIICIEKQSSTCSMNESEFIELIKDKAKIDEKEIIAGIERFSITQRDEYLKAPKGYIDNEVFPWKYNREFSFARRFIVKYKNDKDETILTWGFRNAISAQKQLNYLLFEGKLNNGGKKIEKLLGAFREKKGKIYRNEVKNWLKTNPDLTVIDYEVKIDTNGHLVADKNYGDIDVLVHNTKTNTVYSLECKDTNKAKNIHEMKKEMDNYLGREGQKGMIQKHVERHDWLDSNKEKLCAFLKIDKEPKVTSFMLTSELIPVTYLKAEALPLPIVSFQNLKKQGIELLES